MKRQFFDGGLPKKKAPKPRSTSRLSQGDINPGTRRVTSADDIKKKQQQGQRPDKQIQVSKVYSQRLRTRASKQRAQTIRRKKIESRTKERGQSVQSISSDPQFKRSLEKITGKKSSAFKSQPEPKKLNEEVSKTVNKFKSEAQLKAEGQASLAKKSLLDKLSSSTSAAKKKLSDSIADMKAKFNQKFRSTSEKFPPEIKNKADIEDAGVKNKDNLKKQDANAKKQKLHEAKANDADVDALKTRQPRTDGRADTDPGAPRRFDSDKTPEGAAYRKAKDHKKDSNIRKDKSSKNEADAKKAKRDADDIDGNLKNRSKDGDPDTPRDRRPPDQRMKNEVETARSRVKNQLSKTDSWRNMLKKFMKSITSSLMFLLPIILPILLAPRMPPIGPINTGPPFNPGSVFSPIVFPTLPTGIAPTYRAYVSPTGKLPDLKVPDLSGNQFELPTFNDGYMIFTLTGQPDDTLTFQISTDSSSLELETATLTFPLDTWDTPLRVGYSTTLETDLSGNEEYTRLNIKDRYAKLRNISPDGIKNVMYAQGSIDQYYPSIEEIEIVDRKLDDLLIKDETYAEALENVHQKISRRRKYVGGDIEPTYDASYYVPYVAEEVVIPTHDVLEDDMLDYDSILVIPTYDDDSYSIFEPMVEPSIHIDNSYDFYERDSKTDDPIVEPTLDDNWITYNEPISGGEETDTTNATNTTENDINKIIDSLDYDTLASDIMEGQLSDNYKATIQVLAVDSLNYEITINAVVEDDTTWVLKPRELLFDESTNSNNMFFFSQNIFNTLVNLHVATQRQSIEDNFNNTVEMYESNQTEAIDAQYTLDADAAAKEAYERSMAEEQEKIEAGEYVLERLKEVQSGGASSYLSRLRNRSRKRKIK